MLDPQIRERIENAIRENRIVLYMKGERDEPMCGFSAQVVHTLNSYGVDYTVENVLADWDIREGIKEYSSWPTIPQLFVSGQLVGGCDIVMEMHRKGELEKVLKA